MDKQLTILTPTDLLKTAVEGNQTIENLKALMDLQLAWERNESKKSFYKAMAEFKKICPKIDTPATVKYESSRGRVDFKFAPLGHIMSTINGALASTGLSVRWSNEMNGSRMKVSCHVSHVDGWTESCYMEADPDTSGSKNSIQAQGSTISYLKRYTVSMALGLVTEDDNDGNNGTPPVKSETITLKSPTEKQWDAILIKAKKGTATLEQVRKYYTLSADQEIAFNDVYLTEAEKK